MKVVRYVRRAVAGFYPDSRSLIAFRMLLGLGLLLDLINRYTNLAYFYTEAGMLPRALWESRYAVKPYYWTLHPWNGEGAVFQGLLLLQIALALCLILGVRVRLASLLSWPLMVSLVARNPLFHYGGDKLAPMLLLISAFLPAPGAAPRGSPKEALETQDAAASWFTRLAFLWLNVQVIILYAASGVAKLERTPWQDGSAMDKIFDMNMVVRPLGAWFGQQEVFAPLLKAVSLAVPWLEIIIPVCFLLPFWRGRARYAAIVVILGLNLSIQLMLDVGYFMPYASACLLGLLPTVFWQDLAALRRWALSRSGLGTLTAKLVTALRTLSERARVGYLKLLTPAADTAPAAAENVPPSLRRAEKVGVLMVMLTFFGITLGTGLEGMKLTKLSYEPWAWNFIRGLNQYQNWGLFTQPTTTAIWYVGKAELADGSTVDILQGEPVDWTRQELPNRLFAANSKWRVSVAQVNSLNDAALNTAMLSALRAKWNDEHPPEQHITDLEMYKMSQALPAVGDVERYWRAWKTVETATETGSQPESP